MRNWGVIGSIILGLILAATAACAATDIRVNIATQRMQVTSSSGETYDWPVSTGRRGFATPRGNFGVARMEIMHRSHKYHESPMPHSIFFSGGFAIHGTYETRFLGRAASHGCVRISPDHAAELYRMVQADGAHISITGGEAGESRMVADLHHKIRRNVAVAARRAGPSQIVPALSYAPLAPSYDEWMRDPDLQSR